MGDDATDDWPALQACVDKHSVVFLPPGRFRLSATLDLPPGASLTGAGNSVSQLLASTTGLAGAAPGAPAPLLRTSDADGGAPPTSLSFVGLVTWQHLAWVTTMDWRSRNPESLWRSNFESRDCECLWTSAYQQLTPPALPCSLPVNITVPKSLFRGVGRVHGFVNDDTGGILSTGALYRHLRIADTAGFANATSRLVFYSLNLEHAMSEANADVVNASWVDIMSLKGEGNLPLLWLRSGSRNISLLALGGGVCPFAYNRTLPPDQTQAVPSLLRVDPGVGFTAALLQDHGYGAEPPYWPPKSGGCSWQHHYPYPGEVVPEYPFGTWPNATQWTCWYSEQVATSYWQTLTIGTTGSGTLPRDKPVHVVLNG